MTEELALLPPQRAEAILRWAGSKRRVTPILASHAPPSFNRYFEPFAGSAALFFCLQPQRGFIGDVNAEVTNTYQAVKDVPDRVAQHLSEIPHTKDAYLVVRGLHPDSLSAEQRAARLIFLMKSCFNGVYRTNSSGRFNVPFGTRVYKLPNQDDLRRVSASLEGIEIKTGDYRSWLSIAGVGDFVYLDPPYSSSKRYRGEYGYNAAFHESQIDDLLACCASLNAAGAKVMLSYKWSQQVADGLSSWRVIELEVPRSVSGLNAGRTLANELLAMNY